VICRGMVLILSLSVLLACPLLGWGGRAEAGFALRRVTPSVRLSGASGAEFVLRVYDQDICDAGSVCSSSSPAGNAPVPPNDPHCPMRLPQPLFLLAGSSPAGASSTRAPSSKSPSGAGLCFILPSASRTSGDEQSGPLFLADVRIDWPLFASRLFRPPRVV
jgi:hypothetical protein